MTASTTVKSRATIAFLSFALVACGGGGGGDDEPIAPPLPSAVATTVTASSATTLTGTVAQPVADRPSVIVRDQRGAVMSGVSVTFAVTSGGGTVTGGSATTDASGVATVGGWTLGTTAGANSLSATAGSLPSVVFTATGRAGPATSVVKTTGDGQTAIAGSAVSIAPSVTVRDANNNPVSGVVVTFAVASGGGTITGASATTTSTGIATVGSWTLGNQGTNTLTATSSGVTVTFTATATAPAQGCSLSTPHALGTTTSGQLATSDCQLPTGPYVDFLAVSLGAVNAYLFTQSSTAFNTYLYLSAADGSKIAENDDATGSNSAIKAFLPSGNYLLGASSFAPSATGAYAVTSSTTSANVTNCEKVFVARGVTTAQQLQTTDCQQSGYVTDQYFIYLKAGQAVTISMNSTAVDSYLALDNAAGSRVAENDDRAAGTFDSQIVYTPATAGYYKISAGSFYGAETGSYTLIIQ